MNRNSEETLRGKLILVVVKEIYYVKLYLDNEVVLFEYKVIKHFKTKISGRKVVFLMFLA